MKILSVVGARPQFIKAAPVSEALRARGCDEFLVHTGQHYDAEMSSIFFEELNIHKPDLDLKVGSGPHGWQTGQMLTGLEKTMQDVKPDWVIVYGDTNSTLAGALAASKLRIPIAHVEAGLRSFNREMPEEHNRVLTDHCADLLFCPTQTAVTNLLNEGVREGVHFVGDTMYDATLRFTALAMSRSSVLAKLNLQTKEYLLATVHRPYNADVPENLKNILMALTDIDETIVFPVHPRTRKRIDELNGLVDRKKLTKTVKLIRPVGYLDMLVLEKNARLILTDSGGVQKEAFFFSTPCITLRPETEWLETVNTGWNVLAGSSRDEIVRLTTDHNWPEEPPPAMFGNGRSAFEIAKRID